MSDQFVPSAAAPTTRWSGTALAGSDLAVAGPATAAYRDTGPWNLTVPSAPRAVVTARDAEDVLGAVRYAADQSLRLAVRSTGHGAVPVDSSVVLVSTRVLTECVVHPSGRWARIGAGVTWRHVIEAAAPYGLAPVCGAAPDIGAVGFLTGGGIGPIARTFGVSSDYVRAVEVITGAGDMLRATPTDNEDLFWGLRGGKATLGIVTAMEIDLIELAEVYAGSLQFDTGDARSVLRAWSHWSHDLPEQATTSVAIRHNPSTGRQLVAVRYAWVGDPLTGARYLEPLRAAAPVVTDEVRVRPFTAIGEVHHDPVAPAPVSQSSAVLKDAPDEAIDRLLEAVGGRDNRQTLVELRLLGGAIAREPVHPSASCHRDAELHLFTTGLAVPDATATAQQAEHIRAAVAPWTAPGLLINFEAGANPARIARCYDRDTRHWLAALADQYDPERILDTGQVVRTRPGQDHG